MRSRIPVHIFFETNTLASTSSQAKKFTDMDPFPVEDIGGGFGGEVSEGALYKRKRQNSLNSSLQIGDIREDQASLMKQLIRDQEMALRQLQSRKNNRSGQKIQKQSESKPFSHGNQSAPSTAGSTTSTASPIPPRPELNDISAQFDFAKSSPSCPTDRNVDATAIKSNEQLTDFTMMEVPTCSKAPIDNEPLSDLEQQMIMMQKRLMEQCQQQQKNARTDQEKFQNPSNDVAYDGCGASETKPDSFSDWFNTKAQLFHQKLHHSPAKPRDIWQQPLHDLNDQPHETLNAYERYIAEHRRLEEEFFLQHQLKRASVPSSAEGLSNVVMMDVPGNSHPKPSSVGTVSPTIASLQVSDGRQHAVHPGLPRPRNPGDPYTAGSPQDCLQKIGVQTVSAPQVLGETRAGAHVLAEQISNLAIGDDDDDDSVSVESVGTFDSFDGKKTYVNAIRSQTRAQESACAQLNDAIEDLYGASVKKLIKKFPMVTRLVRANDGSGNVQLHYGKIEEWICCS